MLRVSGLCSSAARKGKVEGKKGLGKKVYLNPQKYVK